MPFWNLHEYLSGTPSYFYTPNQYSIAYYLINDIPSRPFLIIWQLLNIGLFYLLLTLNYRGKVLCSILLTASLTLYFALYYSFGKIDHSYANIIFIPFACMALSSENKWAFNTVVFILMFSFLSAGLFKLLDPTYISYDTHKVFNMIGNKEFNSWFNALDIGGPLKIFIKESFDWATLIFEVVLAVIVLLNYRHIFLYITIACVFHCLINYLLGIPFGGQRLVYIYITLVFLYRHIPWLASILHNLEKLLKNKYFWLILAISYLGHKQWLYTKRYVGS